MGYEDLEFEDGSLFLVTGGAGFIGSNLCEAILSMGYKVRCLDDLSTGKQENVDLFIDNENYSFIKGDIRDLDTCMEACKGVDFVLHEAAWGSVPRSIEMPLFYEEVNIRGTLNMLEAARQQGVKKFVYASSSSVYGLNKKVPYSTEDKVDNPVSLYAATKKSNELMAHSYSKLYGIPVTGLRFFTVYGPAGRPDMAYFGFTNKLVKGEKIQIFNYGNMSRDFTYIDDIITGVMDVMRKTPDETEDGVKYKVYNIGNNQPESLLNFVETLEKCLIEEGIINSPAEKELLPMQPGDVYQTYADVTDLVNDFGFKPSTSIEEGLSKFAKWYKEFYMNK